MTDYNKIRYSTRVGQRYKLCIDKVVITLKNKCMLINLSLLYIG